MSDIANALAAVGPKLRALRQERDFTLAELSARTGISASTISRLEAGQRQPTLELLLMLAKAYDVSVDALIAEEKAEDPRVSYKPIRHGAMTMIPLSRRTDGIQAYKMVIAARSRRTKPTQKTHEGYEWIYVINGRLRLVLGEQDLVLEPGDAAEFDTQRPHWFGAADSSAVEFLSLFGKQGERMHVRQGAEK